MLNTKHILESVAPWVFNFDPLPSGVSINCSTPKQMVHMENPIKMDDLGVPSFMKPPIAHLDYQGFPNDVTKMEAE